MVPVYKKQLHVGNKMVISSQKLHQQPLLLWGQPCANAQCSAGILAVLDSSKTTEYLPPKTLNFEVSTDVSKKNLREAPNIFNWVEIGTFWGCSPPNNALVVKKNSVCNDCNVLDHCIAENGGTSGIRP